MERHIIIETLGAIMSKCASVIKKHGILITTWGVLLFSLLYSFIINPLNVNEVIKSMEKTKEAQHNESVDNRLAADRIVPLILKNIRLENKLDRVCLLEMHNSTESISNLSFLYMSLIYEDFNFANDSIKFIQKEYQSQRTGDYYEVFDIINRKGYAYFEDLENYHGDKAVKLLRQVKANGTNSIALIPLYDKGRINALLVLSSFKPTMDIANISKNTYKQIEQIKAYIFRN